jgi:hypothetical protein
MGDSIPIRPRPVLKAGPHCPQTEWTEEEDDRDLTGRNQTV